MASSTAPPSLTTLDGTSARDLWALEPGRPHLNHGSYGGITRRTADRQLELQDQMRSNAGRWFAHLPDQLADATARIADTLDLPDDGVAPTVNASAAATIVFRSLPLPAGTVALTNNHNYGAVVHALRHSHGSAVALREIDIPISATDDDIIDLYAAALTPEVSVVLLDQFTSSTAMAFPIDRLVPLVKAAGAIVVVDGSHAPGLLANPYPRSSPDAWFGNLHKHLCGPLSSALIVLSPDLRERAWPLMSSWNEGQPFPQRFLTQGSFDWTALLTVPSTLAELEAELGWERIRTHAQALTDWAAPLVASSIRERWDVEPEVSLHSPSPHFALLRLPDWPGPPSDRSAELRTVMSQQAGIEAMAVGWNGNHYLRLCSHAYNTAADYQALATRGLDVLHDHWLREHHQ